MSSIKNLKKEVDNQVFEIISDCFLYTGIHPDNKPEEVSEIIEDAVTLRNDLISRINNPGEKENTKEIRKHYQSVKADLNKGVLDLCGRLSAVSKKKKK
jgi:hypothetical protein